MDFNEWLDFGIAKGWCSDIDCAMHNGFSLSDEEEQDWIEQFGVVPDDPCMPAIRIY